MSDMINEKSQIDKIWQDNFKSKEETTTLADIIKEVSGKALYKLMKEDSALPKVPAFADGAGSDKLKGLEPKQKPEPEGKKVIGGKKLEARDDTEPAKPSTPLKEEVEPNMPPVAEEDDEEISAETPVDAPIEEPIETDTEEVPGEEGEKTVAELISDIESDLAALKGQVAPEETPAEEVPSEEVPGEEVPGEEVAPEEIPGEEVAPEEEEYDEALCKEGMCETKEESIALAEGEFEKVVNEGSEFNLPKNADVLATYRSKSDPTKRYYIIKPKAPGAKEYCTCPAWRFQSKPVDQRTCKHLQDFAAGKPAAVAEKVVAEKHTGFKKLAAKKCKCGCGGPTTLKGECAKSLGGDRMKGL